MKWVTHIAWATVILYMLKEPTWEDYLLIAAHTAITDVFGHYWRGGVPARNKYHDVIAITLAILLWYSDPLTGLAVGLTHVILDWVSPGKLAVSWLYNAVFLAAAFFVLKIILQ